MADVRLLRQVERAAQLLSRHLASRLGDHLTDAEAHVLFHLNHLPRGIQPSMKELRAAFGLRPSTLTAIVDRLERQGLVARRTHPEDRRSLLVVPTASATAAIGRVSRLLDGIEATVASRVTPADLQGCTAVLRALEDALR